MILIVHLYLNAIALLYFSNHLGRFIRMHTYLGTRSIQRIITEGLLLAEAKHPGIVVHSLRHSAATYATLNGAPPSQVQRMMRHKHYGTTEHYVREAQQMLEGAEGKITQI